MKSVKIMLPVVLVIAVISFVVGLMLSTSLKITPTSTAVGQETLKEMQPEPISNQHLFVDLAEKLMPATVNISTTKTVKESFHQLEGDESLRQFFGDDFYERFFGEQSPPGGKDQTLRSLGSGFIVSEEGYIITNNHVIDGADEIKVRLSDKEEYDVTIVGKDVKTDIALIKIDPPNNLPFVKLGDSDG